MILEDDRGEPPEKKTKRNYVRLQERIKSLYTGNRQRNSFELSPSLLDAGLHGLGLSRYQTAELSPDFPHQLIHHDVSAQ
ncbi:hypothetical protein E2C01_061453 [Portunus trituberculatus]|uniref:Uncharacterized protein n=1 Tax=Portunus trituberculatus TaxID=210409 RepID=A0A5B7H596_PORTR|nr:hypothetical protein [Portunus trituberculatus]